MNTLAQTIWYIMFLLTWIQLFTTLFVLNIRGNGIGNEYIAYIFYETVIIWLVTLWGITELLSIFHGFTHESIVIVWGIIVIVQGIYLCFQRSVVISVSKRLKIIVREKLVQVSKGVVTSILLATICVILLRNSFLSVFTVPYNYDSMTYHLSRVMFWIEERSVNCFDTNIWRQVLCPPLDEYIIAHIIILTGGDIFVNTVQTIASFVCTITGYGIMRKIGCDRNGALGGILLMLTMNIFIAESISTQNDVFTAALLLVFCRILIEVCSYERNLLISWNGILLFIMIGISAGLIFCSKTNACLPAVIIALWALLFRFKKGDKICVLLLYCIITIVPAFVVALPILTRYSVSVGDILASNFLGDLTIRTVNPRFVVLNALKNVANCSITNWNCGILLNSLVKISNALNVRLNDPLITWRTETWQKMAYSLNMDSASAYLVTPLLIVASFLWIYRRIKCKSDSYRSFEAMCFLQFLVSTMVICWSPWVTRLLLPSLCLLIMGITSVLNKQFNEWIFGKDDVKSRTVFMSYAVLFIVFFQLISCSSESFFFHQKIAKMNVEKNSDRFELYFLNNKYLDSYTEFRRILSTNCRYQKVGLYTGSNSYQYPLLIDTYGKGQKIKNVKFDDVEDDIIRISNKMNEDYHPNIILVSDIKLTTEELHKCNDIVYRCIWIDESGNYSAWVPQSD